MDLLLESLSALRTVAPLGGTLVLVILALAAADRLLQRVDRHPSGRKFRHQLVMLGLSFAGLIVVILALPISEGTRGQLLSLIGILLSAAIALSSTTLLGNGMAGIMLRAVKNFRSGDFIRSGELRGRVSERGLFHTEIQTPDRELTTIPNLYLVTNPVTVVRSSGTIVAATLSLGYDVPRSTVETALIGAAERCGLNEAFVQVLDLGDFSVNYRVGGLLTDTRQLLSTQSRLRAAVVDALHDAEVEIVSPSFMNTRAFDIEHRFVPEALRTQPGAQVEDASRLEELVFDKAEEAQSREERAHRLLELERSIEEERKLLKQTEDEAERSARGQEIDRLERRAGRMRMVLENEKAED